MLKKSQALHLIKVFCSKLWEWDLRKTPQREVW